VGTWRRYEVPYSTCYDCTVAFQNPMRALDYANGEYRAIVNHKPGVAPSVLAGQERRAVVVMAFLKPRLAVVEQHMDVGSGAGILMREVSQAYRCESRGCEVDQDYLAYSKAQGMYATDALPDGTFDLVTIVHTLEHMPDPVAMLTQIHARAAGHVYIEVPTDKYDIVHPFMFNAKSLQTAIELAGMTLQEMWMSPTKDLVAWL
jgi:2-polyprenyl-3-methyl-5-hydroxy-6-metoxy-1,4-benzoquinol methylase